MKRTNWWAGGIVLLVLAGAAAWWFARDRDGGVSYRTAKIERGSLVAAVSASGTVNPVTQVSVGSQVSGQIKELYADFNSVVKQGQLIARLDPESFEYRVRQASADVDAARASVLTAQANVQSSLASVTKAQVDLAQARRDLQQKKDLVAQNFIASSEVDKAQAGVDTLAESLKVAQAQVEVARAQATNAQANVKQREALLAQARVDLQRTQIKSPVDGIVIKRSIETGQTVAASLQAPELFVIARNLNDMQVEASIDEADISRVKLDQKVSFTIDAFPGRSFEGRVGQMRKAAVSLQNVVSYTVVVAFANPGSLVLPGMTANVRVVTDTRDNVLKVANAALRVRIAGIEPAGAEVVAPAASGGDPGAASPRTGSAGGSAWVPNAMAQSASAPGGGAGGAPLRELRDQLVAELQLTPAQVAAVDAQIAAMRPRFGELRNLPEGERPKARERLLADLRVRLSEQLSEEQRQKYQRMLAESGTRQVTRGRIYLLGDDGKPHAYNVRLGISDGVMTELLVAPDSPDAAALKEGASVITAVVNANAAAPTPARMPRTPF
jgi:HlyD family secretion protein